jgi:hypothetical protein
MSNLSTNPASTGRIDLPEYFSNLSSSNNNSQKITAKLAEIVVKRKICGYVDFHGEVYLDLEGNKSSIRSGETKGYFGIQYNEFHCDMVNPKSILDFLVYVELICKALSSKHYARHAIFGRVGMADNKFYLNLKNKKDEVVEISRGGYRVISPSPVIFVAGDTAETIPTPPLMELGNKDDIFKLRQFVNCSDNDFKLLICYLIQALFPEDYSGGRLALVLEGQAGSAKTTSSKFLKSLIDPNSVNLIGMEQDPRNILLTAKSQWLIVFDNISDISKKQSDTLCTIATKASLSLRKLFTDGEIFSFSVKRPMIINGISDFVHKSDLIDRCLFFNLPIITKRESEKALESDFERERSAVLGALLTILSEVMKFISTEKFKPINRMAEFDIIGQAVEKSLDWDKGTFHRLYAENQESMSISNLHQNVVATSLIYYLRDKEYLGSGIDFSFVMTSTELYGYTKAIFSEKSPCRGKTFPSSAPVFARELYELAKTFAKVGILIARKRSNGSHIIISGNIDKIKGSVSVF